MQSFCAYPEKYPGARLPKSYFPAGMAEAFHEPGS
jgi:hypothetical protein